MRSYNSTLHIHALFMRRCFTKPRKTILRKELKISDVLYISDAQGRPRNFNEHVYTNPYCWRRRRPYSLQSIWLYTFRSSKHCFFDHILVWVFITRSDLQDSYFVPSHLGRKIQNMVFRHCLYPRGTRYPIVSS
jgi:hypothetical protein